MTQNDTNCLPVVIEARTKRPSLLRLAPKAAFLSQLIAERQHLDVQRARRRSTPAVAADAYALGAAATTLRMPAGYRRTVVA